MSAETYGFSPSELKGIKAACSCYPEIQKAYLFGERLKNPNSTTVQLAIEGDGINEEVTAGMQFQLAELQKIPYDFELTVLSTAPNKDEIISGALLFP
jgi:hypothetical protein